MNVNSFTSKLVLKHDIALFSYACIDQILIHLWLWYFVYCVCARAWDLCFTKKLKPLDPRGRKLQYEVKHVLWRHKCDWKCLKYNSQFMLSICILKMFKTHCISIKKDKNSEALNAWGNGSHTHTQHRITT